MEIKKRRYRMRHLTWTEEHIKRHGYSDYKEIIMPCQSTDKKCFTAKEVEKHNKIFLTCGYNFYRGYPNKFVDECLDGCVTCVKCYSDKIKKKGLYLCCCDCGHEWRNK